MENNNNQINTKWIGKRQLEKIKDKEKKPTLYVSPDNLGMLMEVLLVEKYRPLVINGAPQGHQGVLKEAINLYDSGELYNFNIAIVRSNNVLSTNQEYKINMNVKPYSIGEHTLNFGDHTLDGLKTYFNPKTLEQRIYSDSHLIE